jgi:hypothetical protein
MADEHHFERAAVQGQRYLHRPEASDAGAALDPEIAAGRIRLARRKPEGVNLFRFEPIHDAAICLQERRETKKCIPSIPVVAL